MSLSRRKFLKQSAAAAAGLALTGMSSGRAQEQAIGAPFLRNPKISDKVIVLGLDGMDPDLLRRFMAEGKMPTFKRLAEQAHFGLLQTTMPPQSPVAWASFISGCRPGGHGIYDFIHRDPASFTPYMSTTRSFNSDRKLKLGNWAFPLDSGKVELMRKGPALWHCLEKAGVPATVFQIPSNFPVVPGTSQVESGMGTPDLLGSYGTCTFFTSAPFLEKDIVARIVQVNPVNHVITTKLEGPPNPFNADDLACSVPVVINRDPRDNVARIAIGDETLILKQGEWSDWIPVRFSLLSVFAGISGMVRLYMKEVHPNFKLYVSPINVDPLDPSLPICSPEGFSRDLARKVGRFYTQGFPADTKALSNGVLSDEEYLQQADIVLEENLKSYQYLLNEYREGLFFYYFSNLDQNQHMLLRAMDPEHPQYDPNAAPEVMNAVRHFYSSMDDVLRQALEKVDSRTSLMVLSDHGFSPFYREFNLNTWLLENGYIALNDPSHREDGEFFQHVDWERTKAFGLGINGLYMNVKGREKHGILSEEDAERTKQEIIGKLATVTDPKNGAQVITQAYDSAKLYHGPYAASAPDVVVGYHRKYRTSDYSVLGRFTAEQISDRTDKWAADHCLDPAVVPGVFLSNRACKAEAPSIWDLTPTILDAFGVEVPAEMEGKPVWEKA